MSRTSSNSSRKFHNPDAQVVDATSGTPPISTTSWRDVVKIHPAAEINAAVHWVVVEAEYGLRYPMIGGFAACCARVLSGHAAAVPPRSVTKSRRLIASPGTGSRPTQH
jgi:hypothetical protein